MHSPFETEQVQEPLLRLWTYPTYNPSVTASNQAHNSILRYSITIKCLEAMN
jgi:hypothetical protein